MILQKLAESTRLRVETAKQTVPPEEVKAQALSCTKTGTFMFEQALAGHDTAFICEVKKASPSKGVIAEDFPYLAIAQDYEKAGAAAVSVLTEPEYFKGKDAYLQQIAQSLTIPVLRKDFTIDAYQIYEAKLLGAGAVLLICALLDTETIRSYLELCDRLGLSALVEAHDEAEIRSALSAGARVIGVNNRNLNTFEVDLGNAVRLRQLVPPEILFVAESGIKTADDIRLLQESGVNAVLVGETLMRTGDKSAAMRELRGECP